MKIVVNEVVTTINATAEDMAACNTAADSFAMLLKRAFSRICPADDEVYCEDNAEREDDADISEEDAMTDEQAYESLCIGCWREDK